MPEFQRRHGTPQTRNTRMNTQQSPGLDDPIAALMRGFSLMTTAFQSQAGAFAGPATTPVNAVLLQAQAVASATVLRGLQRGAQSWADYGQASAAAPAGMDAAHALSHSVDLARAHLRRLTEIAADEARLLETQLRGLDEQLRAAVTESDPPDAGGPVRRAGAKR